MPRSCAHDERVPTKPGISSLFHGTKYCFSFDRVSPFKKRKRPSCSQKRTAGQAPDPEPLLGRLLRYRGARKRQLLHSPPFTPRSCQQERETGKRGLAVFPPEESWGWGRAGSEGVFSNLSVPSGKRHCENILVPGDGTARQGSALHLRPQDVGLAGRQASGEWCSQGRARGVIAIWAPFNRKITHPSGNAAFSTHCHGPVRLKQMQSNRFPSLRKVT